ncbi:hypothetical protein D030_0255B, partial [Vibrio parahaemolyticus AQ3810]
VDGFDLALQLFGVATQLFWRSICAVDREKHTVDFRELVLYYADLRAGR